MGYQDDVLRMRQAKQAQEIQAERNQHIYGYQEALRKRQEIESEAARTTDPDEQAALRDNWHFWDGELQQCEAEIRRLTPRQLTKEEQGGMAYMHRRQAFINRHGQKAIQAIDLAHQHLASTRNWKVGSPRYYKALDTLIEMYGPDYLGVRFDPESDIALTPNEAAKISGLSPERYNQYVRAAQAAGRFSWQQKK